MAVHLAGWPCDMDPIMALPREQQACGDRGLCPGTWRHIQTKAGRIFRSLGSFLLLPGQDNDNWVGKEEC